MAARSSLQAAIRTRIQTHVRDRQWDIMAVLVAALAVASAFLADQSRLWVDEKITVNLVTKWSLWELVVLLPQHQPHLPTYYVFLEVVGFWLGHVVSIVAFPVTVVATIQAGRELHGSQLHATLAGYLVAFSPYLATQAGWLRMYSLLTAILTVGLWQTLAGHDRRAATCFLAACLLHPFAIFPLGWFLAVTYHRRHTIPVTPGRATLAVTPLVALVVVKFLRGGPGFSAFSTGVTHGATPGVLALALVPVTALVGAQYTAGQVVLALGLTVTAAVPRGDRRLLLYVLVPIVGVAGVTYLLHPVFQPKYFGYIAPAVALLIARERESWTHQYVVALLAGGLLVTMWFYRAFGYALTRYYRFLF